MPPLIRNFSFLTLKVNSFYNNENNMSNFPGFAGKFCPDFRIFSREEDFKEM